MISRVLCSAINYDHPQRGMFQAFRELCGEHAVHDYDYLELQRRGQTQRQINDGLVRVAREHAPDWLWLQLQDTGVIQPDAILAIREALPSCVVTHWTGDVRPSVSSYLSSICKVTHATLASSQGRLPSFVEAGARVVRYVQIGLDYEEDVLGLPEWTPPFRVPDVVFVGGNYSGEFPGTKDRQEAVTTLMDAGIDVGVVGPGWPAPWPCVGTCDVKQQHHVWRRAKVGLSVHHFNHIECYYSDRQLISMASGTPIVCYAIPGIEREFTPGVHCCMYRTQEELLDQVRWLLSDEGARERIGAAGREEVIKNHTWLARFRSLLPFIEELRQALPGSPAQVGLAGSDVNDSFVGWTG